MLTEQEKAETIWASKKRRVQYRALATKKGTLEAEQKIKEIQEKKTLWDEYAMAALTGWLANGDYTLRESVEKAAVTADFAMEERRKRDGQDS